MNRLNKIITDYLTPEEELNGDIDMKEYTKDRLGVFLDDLRKDKEDYNSLMNIICEDFNVMIDTDRLFDAIEVFGHPLATIRNIIIKTINDNRDILEHDLKTIYEKKKDLMVKTENTLCAIYNLPQQPESIRHYFLIGSMLQSLIYDILYENTEYIPVYFPTIVNNGSIVYKEPIMETLLKGVDLSEVELVQTLLMEIQDDLFSNNMADIWLKFEK